MTSVSWRIDETYIKVKGSWCYYYISCTSNSP
ncbi:DDE-type integrase/transposase/recombinase [Marinomonas algicola]